MKKSLVLFSGGMGSALSGWLEALKKGSDNCIFYFNDTLIEDDDLYRFLVESLFFINNETLDKDILDLTNELPWYDHPDERKKALLNLGSRLTDRFDNFVYDTDGRNPWQVFFDESFLANSRIDTCSKVLKRQRAQRFIKKFKPDQIEIVTGFDWSEVDRLERAYPNWQPFKLLSPMCPDRENAGNPWVARSIVEPLFLSRSSIKKPLAYDQGFTHNNCGKFCVKAGLDHFYLLWKTDLRTYTFHEEKQEWLHQVRPKTKPFLKKTTNKVLRYLTLREFRIEYLETGLHLPGSDFGGCVCAV